MKIKFSNLNILFASSVTFLIIAAGIFLFDHEYGVSQWLVEENPETQNSIENGERLYVNGECGTCHGSGGDKPTVDAYPRINGQSAVYIENQLLAFKFGKRNGGMSELMIPLVENLTDSEIRDLANFVGNKLN